MGGSAPAQDPNMGIAAKMSAQTGQEMLRWMQDQARVTNRWAETDRRFFNQMVRPEQRAFIREASNFDTPGRQNAQANRAAADVALAAGQQQGQMQRQMAAMGVNPNSGRALSAMSGFGMDTALATAGARNLARRSVQDQGRNLRAAAISMGQGYQVNPGQAMGLSNSAGQAGFGGAMQGFGQQANILNQDYQNRYQAWAANQQALGGVASGLGMGLGLLL